MGSFYVTDMVDVLRAAGCQVAESSTTNGWQTRSRSSGGFPGPPLGIQWHHTASNTSPANDLHWQIVGCTDAPVGNVLLDRTGTFWPVAAGAANTAGKGGPMKLSRGTVAVNNANATTFAIEAANDGVGGAWPQVQVDAYFAGSNALNRHWGNQPEDIFSHALGAGDGWTDRKIDPARADRVEGPWRPRSVNSSGTWSLADMRAECRRRWTTQPAPQPEPEPEEEDMQKQALIVTSGPGGQTSGAVALCDVAFRSKLFLEGGDADALRALGYESVTVAGSTFDRIPGAQQWQETTSA